MMISLPIEIQIISKTYVNHKKLFNLTCQIDLTKIQMPTWPYIFQNTIYLLIILNVIGNNNYYIIVIIIIIAIRLS
jgi:hypothetical protein